MAIADGETVTASASGVSEGKVTTLCRMPFWHTGGASARTGGNVASSTTSNSSSSLTHHFNHGHGHHSGGNFDGSARQTQQTTAAVGSSVSSVARSLLPKRRRLRLDPPTKLYFPCEMFFLSDFFSPLGVCWLVRVLCVLFLGVFGIFFFFFAIISFYVS